MKFCFNCGKPIKENTAKCPFCGCIFENPVPIKENPDKTDVGLCVLSALIPIFGVIYYFATCKATPQKAKSCLISALVAFAVYFVALA